MKIADVGRILPDGQTAAAVQERPAVLSGGYSFRRRMTDLGDVQYQKYIEDLKSRIFAQGEAMKKKADIGTFQQYRRLIAELAGEAAGNAYACGRSGAFDAKGRHRIWVTIKKVNSRLDAMAQDILCQQSDGIERIKMVDDIRGLLVDMFL